LENKVVCNPDFKLLVVLSARQLLIFQHVAKVLLAFLKNIEKTKVAPCVLISTQELCT
jgi:hypothetical protein